ncbi:MAG: hypothetical protein LHW41_05465 [Candidatus Cloacimonetes bacterium]|nr:hypothetical protein [Candidatus Cloacimonadota bacterium]
MKHCVYYIVILFFCATNIYSTNIIDEQLAPEDNVYASWMSAGLQTIPVADSTYNMLSLPDWIVDINNNPVPSADLDETTNDVVSFRELFEWISRNQTTPPFQSRIIIPAGKYLLTETLILPSNICLKGSGSNSTYVYFDIRDTQNNTMTIEQYRSNCFEIRNSKSRVGIEDINISRSQYNANFISAVFDSLTVYVETNMHSAYHSESSFHGTNERGNNILIYNATQCWISGVESNVPYKNHLFIRGSLGNVTNHVSVSGCLFVNAVDHGGGGFGYGTYLGDYTEQCLIENNIFTHLRHGVVVADRSKYNVISYNYIRDPVNSENSVLYGQEYTGDIVIHGQPTSEYYGSYLDTENGPSLNLIEGNSIRCIWVDSFHGKNGLKNTFLRNRINDIGMHTYGPWAIESVFFNLAPGNIPWDAWFCQPRQLIVNNYMKCTHWFLSNFYAFPRRLKGDPQFEKSTKQRAINFWGKVFNSNKEWDSDVWDSNYSYYKVNRPDFFPVFSNWPLNPGDEFNPAQLRWEASGKLTVGRDDPVGYAGIFHYVTDVTFTDDFTVDNGEALIIDKGVSVRIAPGKKIIVKGTLIASGNESQPISFVCSDSTQTWDGIDIY